jgi:segregation and condensation protein B
MNDELIEVLEQDALVLVEQQLELTAESDKPVIKSEQQEANLSINQDEFRQLKLIVEALLMAADQPLTIVNITDILTTHNEDHNTRVKDKVTFSKKYITLALDELATDFADRAIEVKYLGAGYRIQTKAEYACWVQGLWQEKPTKYSKATLETLAIIAYRQPITRGEIEHIRGVAVSSHIIRTLLDRDWIKVVGYRDLPGKPGIYATTPQFLVDLNLEKLEDLPTLADIKEIKADLFSSLESINPLENMGTSTEESELENLE